MKSTETKPFEGNMTTTVAAKTLNIDGREVPINGERNLLAGLYKLRQLKRNRRPVNRGWDEGPVCMS